MLDYSQRFCDNQNMIKNDNNPNSNKGSKAMKIKTWMINHINEHIDSSTGILNMTALAEDCSDSLFGREAGDTEFDIACDVGEQLGVLA